MLFTLFYLFFLYQAKKDYEREEWKKEQAKIRGEDTWMLPALNDRLEREQKVSL